MSNSVPRQDGEVAEYFSVEARGTRWWNAGQSVLFINGMSNSGEDHRQSALALSRMQMRPVVGIYNSSSGAIPDLFQCLGDKWQWDGHGLDRTFHTARTRFLQSFGNHRGAEQAMLDALQRNAPAVSMFREIRERGARSIQIFAHSQGNLILANALTALKILRGQNALNHITVHSYGSPTMTWPTGFRHREHGYTFDPVTWLAGFDASMRISKVGVPARADAVGVVSHSFLSYLLDDAAFVINRFRFGGLGLTASMNEEGLAAALVEMGRNLPRVTAIFQRLDSVHHSDVDDIAELYVRGIENNQPLLSAVRADSRLRELLIRSLDEGVTFRGEQSAIDVLRS